MIRFLEISNHTFFWYYLASNLAYLLMLITALKTSAMHQRRLESHRLNWFKEMPMTPPITLIVPAHNEEASIRVNIRNLLKLDYPELEIIVVPILEDPKRVVAVGGIVRVLNGSELVEGQLRRVRMPRKSIEAIQVIEYLRAFLIGREAWAQGNMLTIISGAFGVFRTDLVRAVGGYRASSIGEDMDLVARLHRHMRRRGADYQVRFVPDPMCWTEAPSDLRSLARQRARWQKGLLDVLWSNRDMLFRSRYGRIGCFAFPYLWLFELFAPIMETLGIATIVLAAALNILSREFFLQFLIFGYAFATVISIGSVLQEEITYKRYNDWKDVVRLVSYCFFEHFPYRQLHMVWCLQGLWQYLLGDHQWKTVKRKGLVSATAE